MKRSIGVFSSTAASRLRWRTFCAIAICLVGLSSPSTAGTITVVPPGLAPGSPYRLVFVTDTFYSATSSNIADYNTEVNNEANGVAALAALGTTWKVIGSTAAVDAIDNIGPDTGAPIFNLSGNKVAANATTGMDGLFSGGLLAPIYVSESGRTVSFSVWTGAATDGGASVSLSLGSTPRVMIGLSDRADSLWIAWGEELVHIGPLWEAQAEVTASLYAISDVLTVPDSSGVPEPRTTLMMALGGTVLIAARRRMIHRKNRATQTPG